MVSLLNKLIKKDQADIVKDLIKKIVKCNIVTGRQGDRQTERQRDRETERQRDRETERQRDRETDFQEDYIQFLLYNLGKHL